MAEFPPHLLDVVPASTQAVWTGLAPYLPAGAYLVGGTGIAVHLGHRPSRDLDFFVAQEFDPAKLADRLNTLGPFHVTRLETGTLNGYLGETKIQFLDASPQHRLEPLIDIEGIPVAGLGDLFATKLKVIGDRGELRDYFDVLVIERDGRRGVEEGLALFLHRYRPGIPEAAVLNIVRDLGFFGDVADDPTLPMERPEIERYWTHRQPEIVRSLDRLGLNRKRPSGPGIDHAR